MTEKDEKRVQLEAEMLIARGTAAAAGVDRNKKFDALIAKYGSADKIPREELLDHLGPMDEIAKVIRLTSALQDLSNRFELPFPDFQAARAVGAFIHARLTDPDVYQMVNELHHGPNDHIRPGVVKLMLKLGDITQQQIDAKANTPEEKAKWTRWLDSNPFEKN